MIKEWLTKKRGAQFAILLTLSIATSNAAVCWGQAAGFAQSRHEETAVAASGTPRRSTPRLGSVSSIRTSEVAPSSRSTQRSSLALESTPLPNTSKLLESSSSSKKTTSEVRSSRLARKSASPGGRASALLDELEEGVSLDSDRDSDSENSRSKANGARRSLRVDSSASLELLVDEEEGAEFEESDSTVISTDDEPIVAEEAEETEESTPASVQQSAKSKKVEKKSAKKSEESNALAKAPVASKVLEDADEEEYEGDSEAADSALEAARGSEEDEEESVASSETSELELEEECDSNASKFLAKESEPLYARSAKVEVSAVGPKRLIVGQAADYKIFVRNVGNEAARGLVVTTELPDTVSSEKAVSETGTASFDEVGVRADTKRCVWKVGTLDAGDEAVLSLSLTPTKRIAFELVSRYDFERTTARADVEVQEPILEASIEGRDSIEWGVEDKYRIRLRNVGDGDAEDVKLFVSTGENEATQEIGTLRAGEEKTIETALKTTLDNFVTIDARATGAYGVAASATKKIATLRGKLDVEVVAPDLLFVDGEFEAKIRVRNIGDAPLQNVDIVAQIPKGVELIDCPIQARRNDEKRRVYWSAAFIRPEEEASFSVLCRVNTAGSAKFEVVGVDRSGAVAQAEAASRVEAIAMLAMRVKAPKEPVAVGKKCFYELIVENKGTRDARDVNSGIFLGNGMKPLAVEGDRGAVFEEDSKVLFKKIERLRAGETIVFRVEAQALAPGNQKVQAMLKSASEDVSLLSEETTYCYSRSKLESSRFDSANGAEAVASAPDEEKTVRK